jgi:GT2 family glycosyltransferase
MKMDNLLFLPFDLYTRNKIISYMIKEIKHSVNSMSLKILDVGGRNGRLRDFLENSDDFWILDTRESEGSEKNYIVGDIKSTHFKDGEFDIVVSSDVYEHLPPVDRTSALSEMLRISKLYAILAAPFNSPEVVDAEITINRLYKELTGKEHIWLVEHIKNGLPSERELEDFLRANKLEFIKIGSNNIKTWLYMQHLYFIFSMGVPGAYNERLLSNINLYYNSFYDELGDAVEPTYRKIFLISKTGMMPHLQLQCTEIDHAKSEELNNFMFIALINLFKRQTDIIKRKDDLITQICSARGWRLLERYRNSKLVKAIRFFRREGFKKSIIKIGRLGYSKDIGLYKKWILKNEPSEDEVIEMKIIGLSFVYKPKISIIVPTFNTPEKILIEMIDSVINQTYPNWELCIADGGSRKPYINEILNSYTKKDDRIKVKFLTGNKGIAGNSNEALSLATGDFITFLDHDDVLAPFAFFEVVKAINENPEVDFIYSDEDKISNDGKKRFDPFFKADWSPDTLRSQNYICHLTVIKKELLNRVGWFKEGYEGSQDYDLILRATENANKIHHIPKILYHWRANPSSAAGDITNKMYAFESGKKAITDHLVRIGRDGIVEDGLFLGAYKVVYDLKESPTISIIIPNRDHADDLEKCVQSIINRSTYSNFEIIIVENGSIEKSTFHLYGKLGQMKSIKIVTWDKPFNYAALNNFAVDCAKGEILLFINNDTEVITSNWLECMLEHAVRKEVGAVGAKLYYPDDTIQHAGVIIGIGGVAGHSHKYFPKDALGYFGRPQIIQNLSAVTAACMMIRKEVFDEVGRFDEGYSHAFNDVDLCMKIREKGYLVVFTPYAELYHYESKTRGNDDTPEKQERFKREVGLFKRKWGYVLENGDPYYNSNLTLDKEDFSIGVE